MNTTQSWTPARVIFAVLTCVLLLGYLAYIATYSDPTTTGREFVIPAVVWILRVAAAVMAICLGKLWKDKGFLILMAYLFLKVVRIVISGPEHLFEASVSEALLAGLWAFSACYGLARVFSGKQLKQVLGILVSVWTIGMVIYSSIGIYAAWTDQKIFTTGGGAMWGIHDRFHRLFLVYYITVGASVLSMSSTIAVCGAALAKRKASKILFILSVIPMIIAMSLTDSRGSQISAGAGIAVAVGITVLTSVRQRAQSKGQKGKAAWPAAVAVTAIIFIAVVLVCMNTINAFNKLRAEGLVIPRALADAATKKAVSNRGFTGSNVLTNRPMIWKAAIEALKTDPTLLLWGSSIWNSMAPVNAVKSLTFMAAHCHDMPLMILLENGIPGLMLVGLFLAGVFRKSFRLLNDRTNRWERLVIPVFISIATFELVECFTWLRSSQAPMLPFFFVAVGILTQAGEKQTGISE